ncbi:MAG: very short patch repair endonuclease [Alphaproteobacteria bacterium HGW-Alphaproteobacteria-12]|nr:MAG: very short patch repair endonuclease [Alphaproteobacteria bacterium HGW-Alphaproteobacteria-12]
MPDVVDTKTRSRMMAGIRGIDTKPEMLVRRGLHLRGFRYRLHVKELPGKPDLVFRSKKAVVFINGCFWHGHNCRLFKWPSSRVDFWRQKISGNQARDIRNTEQLLEAGWRVLIIWECALKGRERLPVDTVLERAAVWLRKGARFTEIRGTLNGGR